MPTSRRISRKASQYFVALKDRKRDFCPETKCKELFHTRQRIEDGYYEKRRQDKRKNAIRKAYELKTKGRARKVSHRALFEQIKQSRNLPGRVVEQILSEDLSLNPQQLATTAPHPKRLRRRRTAGHDSAFMPAPLTREQLQTIIAEEAHRDEVYTQRIRAARQHSQKKPARKSSL